MQLTTIDRSAPRPAGSEGSVPVSGRTAVGTPESISPATAPTVSVVNNISPGVQAQAGATSSSTSASTSASIPTNDPLQGGSAADSSNKDWTQRKGAVSTSDAPKAQDIPPKPPLSQVLMDNLQAAWTASAKVVEIWLQNNPGQNPAATQQVQAQTQAINRVVDPMAVPGQLGKQVLTYTPQQVKKTEKPE